MAKSPLEVRFAVACDQVRKEDNGKFILIGVYGKDVRLVTIPATIVLTVVLGVFSEAPIESCPLSVRASFDEQEVYSGTGEVSISKPGNDLLVVPNVMIHVPTEGDLKIDAKVGTGRWRTVLVLPLNKFD